MDLVVLFKEDNAARFRRETETNGVYAEKLLHTHTIVCVFFISSWM